MLRRRSTISFYSFAIDEAFVSSVVLQPFGVLGAGLTADKQLHHNGSEPTEMASVCICDPAGLHHIQPPGGPKGAGGAAGAIYKWLGIDQDEAFTDDVIDAVTRPGDAKHHQYALRGREAHVIHSVGPDLRKNSPSRAEALFVLTR